MEKRYHFSGSVPQYEGFFYSASRVRVSFVRNIFEPSGTGILEIAVFRLVEAVYRIRIYGGRGRTVSSTTRDMQRSTLSAWRMLVPRIYFGSSEYGSGTHAPVDPVPGRANFLSTVRRGPLLL